MFISWGLLFLLVNFSLNYYHLLVDLAKTPYEKLGAWTILLIVCVIIGNWSIKFYPIKRKKK